MRTLTFVLVLGLTILSADRLCKQLHRLVLIRVALHLDQPAFQDNAAYFPAAGAQLWRHDSVDAVEQPWLNPFPMPLCHGLELEEASIGQMQTWLRNNRLTSRQLTKCYLDRIRQLNKWYNLVLEADPNALHQADELDLERLRGRVKGPLHGIPYFLKNNIAASGKMETTAGSFALMGSIVAEDAHVVHLLRQQVQTLESIA